MLIRKPADLKPSEITPESVFLNRRTLLRSAGFLGASTLLSQALAADTGFRRSTSAWRASARVL